MLYATRVMQVMAVAGGRGGRRRPDAAEVENPQKAAKERENAYPDPTASFDPRATANAAV